MREEGHWDRGKERENNLGLAQLKLLAATVLFSQALLFVCAGLVLLLPDSILIL